MKRTLFCFMVILASPFVSKGQIFQDKGAFKGKLASVDICDNSSPVVHNNEVALAERRSDSAAGAQGTVCKMRFDGEQTQWQGPDTAIRTIDLSCFYANGNFGKDSVKCGSRTEFSSLAYSSHITLPDFYKPLWNVSIDISFSGQDFLNENVFVRVEVTNELDDSRSVTSLILPCDDQNAFSGDSPGEIVDLPAGKYVLKIYQPDYVAMNHKSNPTRHKKGNIYVKYKVSVTGHD